MRIIKDAIKALKDVESNNQILLVALGEQNIESKSQETSSVENSYRMKASNYILNINGDNFVFTIKHEELSSRYRALEDDWIDETSTDLKKTSYYFCPLYVMNIFGSDTAPNYSECYVVDHLKNNDNLPDSIRRFSEELIKLSESSIKLDNENYDPDYLNYLDELKIQKQEEPDMFLADDIVPMRVRTNLVFDLQLSLDELPMKYTSYLSETHKKEHEEAFNNYSLIDDIKNSGVNIDVVRKLNELANKSGRPRLFLDKLDKYSNSEAIEIYHMMIHGKDVVKIFMNGLHSVQSQSQNFSVTSRQKQTTPANAKVKELEPRF